ncbi:MAG: 3-keto-disaccharide hydrolase [Armatimonadota bacterium]
MMADIGYDDTPILPGTNWHVHDGNRPQPPIVTPGTPSTQEQPGEPPSDAVVLFDGTDLSNWESREGGPAEWEVEDGYMQVVPGTGYIRTKEQFGDCQLHVEWAAPSEVKGEGQGRGNSGVFLMGRYEVQVLDCYDNPTYPDGTTGALYGQYPPLANACRRPGEWQVYDIIWEGPRFEGDECVRPARITVMLNGVVLHHATELRGPTSHRVVTEYEPHPEVGPLELQDHGDLVRFRNIWYRPLKDYDEA